MRKLSYHNLEHLFSGYLVVLSIVLH